MLVRGEKFPIVADTTKLMLQSGFRYRDRIIWSKPKGYTRISRRSGVVLQHPYPMYFYPDNIHESILIFQKGESDYESMRRIDDDIRQKSKIDITAYNANEWHLSVWNITNVLPVRGRIEDGVAAYPEEIPRRLIRLFSYVGETILDPFLGSGTTMKVARELNRNCWGYEIDLELRQVILRKIYERNSVSEGRTDCEIVERSDARRLRGPPRGNARSRKKKQESKYSTRQNDTETKNDLSAMFS
jgi:DNA modification methylase